MGVTLCTTPTRVVVKGTPFDHKEILKAIAGARWDRDFRAWTYPLSPSILPALLSLYPSAEVDKGIKNLMEASRRMQLALSSKSSSKDSLPPIQSRLSPWEHQLQSYHFARHLLNLGGRPIGGGVLLGLDMGTGKTKVIYDLIQNNSELRTILVMCPKSVIDTWEDERTKHQLEDITIRSLLLGDQETRSGKPKQWPVKKRTEAARRFLSLHSPEVCTRIVVINHESAWREPFRTFVRERIWDLLVVDECHRAKAPGGKFSMFLAASTGVFACRAGLTGTPMPKDPLDIYAQARFLDPGVFGTSYTKFKARYGVFGGFENRKLLRLQNEEEFQQKLDTIMIRVKSDDVLDLPEQIHESRFSALSAEEYSAYHSMKETLLADLGSGVVTAANALVRLLRLQQIVQGTVRDDNGREVRIGNSKQLLLQDMLEDLPASEPVVVFARFSDDLVRVHETCESIGRGSLELSGTANQLASWKNGDAPILAVQYQAGGVGVDLSRSRYTIYYSPTFDMGAYEQSVKRTHRPGQTRTTFYYHLQAKGTIDVDIARALRDKKKTVEAVLGGLT
jgi:SNF2 family DNA or RNA helicase